MEFDKKKGSKKKTAIRREIECRACKSLIVCTYANGCVVALTASREGKRRREGGHWWRDIPKAPAGVEDS